MTLDITFNLGCLPINYYPLAFPGEILSNWCVLNKLFLYSDRVKHMHARVCHIDASLQKFICDWPLIQIQTLVLGNWFEFSTIAYFKD